MATIRQGLAMLKALAPSFAASGLTVLGAFLSLGTLGLVFYYLCYPVLSLVFSPLDDWDQSLVWPLIIAMPVSWSPAFVLTKLLDLRLAASGWGGRRRLWLRLGLLWLLAVATWALLLSLNTSVWR